MSVNITFSTKDKAANPLAAELFIDGVSQGTNTTHTIALTTEQSYDVQLVPTDTDYKTYNQSFFIPNQLQSYFTARPINVTLTLITDNVPLSDFIVFRDYCSNNYRAYDITTTSQTQQHFSIGGEKFLCGRSIQFYLGATASYVVSLTTTFCSDGEELCPTCGPSPLTGISCISSTPSEQTISHIPTKPEVSFLFTCDAEMYSNETDSCTEDCNCNDKYSCDCIQKNTELTVTPTVTLNNTDCGGTSTINWYVDDILQETQVFTTVDELLTFDISFSEVGKYCIKAEVITCCGTCTYTRCVSVGTNLTLIRTDCGTYTILNNRVYEAPKDVQITIKDLDSTILSTIVIEDYDGTTPLNIVLSKDGIYLIEFAELDGVSVTYSKTFSVYEYCRVVDCYRELVRVILCPECDCDFQVKDARDLQDKANQFLLVANAFYQSTNIQFGKTFGLFYYQESYLDTLKEHEFLLNRLLQLCGNCGINTQSKSVDPKDCDCVLGV